ncbi:MAG: hypothetical protein KGI52_15645 [Burkholderiales bacterium]|nr:hypothetical protein [Burkholderiales bacterium]
MITQAELTSALRAAVEQLRDVQPVDATELWSQTQAARYLGYSPEHFRARIATRPSFKRAVTRLQLANDARSVRYKAAEVVEWAQAQKTSAGAP